MATTTEEEHDLKAKMEKHERYANDKCTVADLYQELMPGWNSLEDWFMWAPDVFLLTSIIFKRTGCYRQVLKDRHQTYAKGQDEKDKDQYPWEKKVRLCARSWLIRVNEGILKEEGEFAVVQKELNAEEKENINKGNEILDHLIQSLEKKCESVTVNELKTLATPAAVELCHMLLLIHAIADNTCAGFGLLNGSSSTDQQTAMATYLANLLLVGRGSLSGVPKLHGIVIPKMRTPQSGISPRSLSLHLSYHTTEVEVVWRVIPWTNIDENTINILTIPWPLEISENCFGCTPDSFQPVRYFTYKQNKNVQCQLTGVVEMVCKLDEEIGKIHVILFPELALTEAEYELLMALLDKARKGHFSKNNITQSSEIDSSGTTRKKLSHVPMIVSGICEQKNSVCNNEVRMAAYFADKWYDLTQAKHHRWKLDRNQIQQYSLEGRLSTTRYWYEDMEVAQRRLTFLVPNGWLSLCPLICEDLAQLEPVSELIRGVGPTLLMALLLDGPQLKERWPARYASVFADDPGTAVLTLTSIGMLNRSVSLQMEKNSQTPSRIIALWKDQIKGWHTVNLEKSNRTFSLQKDPQEGAAAAYPNAALLTISADWKEEYTADGRSDGGSAAAFKIEGDRPILIETVQNQNQSRNNEDANELNEPKPDFKGGWPDIRELSAITFALDALINAHGNYFDSIKGWLLFNEQEISKINNRIYGKRNYKQLISLMRESLINPENCGIASDVKKQSPSNGKSKLKATPISDDDKWPSTSMIFALNEIDKWKKSFLKDKDKTTFEYWSDLFEKAKTMLPSNQEVHYHDHQEKEEKEQKRVNRGIPIAVLSALHNRIERFRGTKYKGWMLDSVNATPYEAQKLLENIETTLREHA